MRQRQWVPRLPTVYSGFQHGSGARLLQSRVDARGRIYGGLRPDPAWSCFVPARGCDNQHPLPLDAWARAGFRLVRSGCRAWTMSRASWEGRVGGRTMTEPIGRVVGTTDATPLAFSVALTEGEYLQLDDVVVCTRELPDDQTVTVSGVVTQVKARHEGARFDSDVFLVEDGVLPRRRARSPRSSPHASSPRSSCRRCPAPRSTAPRERARPGALLRSDGGQAPDRGRSA